MSSEREEHVLGDPSDFPVGTHRVVKVGRREIGVFNIGPHQTGPLCEGKSPLGTLVAKSENDWKFEWVNEGEIVVCPWHGLEYHVPTGRCLAYPNVVLRSYEVVVEGGEVRVRL